MRRAILVAASLIPFVALSPPAVANEPDAPPNIILIVADDLGVGDVGCYGGRFPTPNIDSIAKQGVRFSSAYVTAPTCSPSRAGLLTGYYQQRFGVEFNCGPRARTLNERLGLPDSATTIAEALSRAGYATGIIGKWHLGTVPEMHPNVQGFHEFFGFMSGAHTYRPSTDAIEPIQRNGKSVVERGYLTDAFGREAAAFIDGHHEKPFFLYVPMSAPHTPIEATKHYLDRFPQTEGQLKAYAAMVSALDDAVGDILTALREHDIEERTIVFFMSDNGATGLGSNLPFRFGKGFLFEGGIRVPFVAQWPGKFERGMEVSVPISALDVYPTCLSAVGVDPPTTDLDGLDLAEIAGGERAERPERVLFFRHGANSAVRLGKWKLIQSRDSAWLFDVENDPGEEVDLSALEAEKAASLKQQLDAWLADLPPPAWTGRKKPDVEIDGKPYEIRY